MAETTRGEHVEWCKARARMELDAGRPDLAVASMLGDLAAHPETKDLVRDLAAVAIDAAVRGPDAVRKFIEGF